MNIQEHLDEARKLRERAEALKKDATGHTLKASTYSRDEELDAAQQEEQRGVQATEEAARYEKEAADHEGQAADLQREVDSLVQKRQDHLREANDLDKQIQNRQGRSTGLIGGLFT